ncbi:hypothetical protein [Falsibacillus albus]|uniref:Lipoprotein n=1 Tax=Falsibacillus albus TaxID=2478915 RepID=A0A3L7K2R2_9BACI|nr:hypothetical protein [Falsibacillus albus]RLQ97278.1 hypothetical protein D9X91_03770 [Falsibacillus albus]
MKKFLVFTSLLLIITGCSHVSHAPKKPSSIPVSTNVKKDPISDKEQVMIKTEEIYKCLKEERFACLSSFIDSEKGILFSPYVFIPENALIFKTKDLETLDDDDHIYTWGTADGSGMPIELAPTAYFDKFILNNRASTPDEIIFDRLVKRGNMISNLKVKYPNGMMVEYHFNGTEKNDAMDWSSLYFVFEKDKHSEWKLVALIHSQWTI